MRKIIFLLCAVFISMLVSAQETKTLGVDAGYETMVAAFSTLNTNGPGANGIIVQVPAGYTESITADLVLTATGTLSAPITFQKTGTGANPLITRSDAGLLATTTLGGQGDAIIIIEGSDYVTFDGIDVATLDQGIEYGYYIRKASVTDGAKNVIIKNASITMTKGTSAYVVGIYSSNNDAASLVSSATGITVSTVGGINENVSITGNTISNVFTGILLRGYSASSPYDLYDQNFVIGTLNEGNVIQNFAGNASSTAYGIYMIYHNNLNIDYNTVNNTAGGGSGFTSTGYGVYTSTATSANIGITNNVVTLTSNATTSGFYGINSAAGSTAASNTVTIAFNNVSNCSYTTATTGVFSAIVNSGSAATINMHNNIVADNTQAGTGIVTLLDAGGATTSTVNMYENQVYNNVKTGASGYMYATRAAGGTVIYNENEVHDNGFSATSGSSTCYLYGYYNGSSPPYEYLYNNNIYNLYIRGTNTSTSSLVRGIYTYTTSSATKDIYNNQIYGLEGTQEVTGIYQYLGATVNIYKNKIYNLTSNATSTTAARTSGILVYSGAANVFNNFISQLYAPASGADDAVRGINIVTTTSTTTIGVYYNTVYLDALSSGTNFGSTGLYHTYSTTATSATLDMRNNIIVNKSTPNGTGNVVAFRRSSATNLNNYGETSNNNAFYAGTPGTNNLIFYDGTNADQTIGDFKTRVTPRETASFSEDVSFVNVTTSPYNLTLSLTTPTQCESGGQQILSPIVVTDDYFGTTRALETGYAGTGIAPDIGAFEGEMQGLDLIPPVITYTPLENTAFTSARTLTVTIFDASGVPVTGTGLPMLYWSVNSGSYTGVQGVHVSGDDYSFTFGSGVSTGDTISYYIVAQDNMNNVGAFPNADIVSYSVNPPSCTPAPSNASYYEIVQSMSGNYTINSTVPTGGTNFISFTDFAAFLNTAFLTGPVVVDVVAATGPYTEQIILGQITNSSATNTITINGNGETLQYLSTNTNERATLKLDGTDYLTVNNLIVKALGTTTSEYGFTVQLMNEADFNTFDNCEFHADIVTTSSNYCPFVTSNSATAATTAGLAASNLTVTNCKVIGGYYGMVINGNTSTAPFSENNVITNNEIMDFYYYGLYIRGQNNSEFIGNEIHRTNRTNNSTAYMLYVNGNISNSEISKNIVYNFTGTGTTTTSSGYGIYFTSVTNPVNEGVLVANNVVYGWADRNGLQYGLYLSITGEAQIYHNTISMDHVGHTGSSTIYTVYQTGASAGLDIKNNIFSYTSNSTGTKYCMYFATSTSLVSSDNNVLHVGATAGTNNTGYWSSTAYATLAGWQTANGGVFDQNSFDADPVFSSPLVTPSSAVIDNSGVNLLSVVPDDIFGTARTASPDPGAIEFDPPACPIPYALTATNVTHNSADLGWTSGGTETEWNVQVYLAGGVQGVDIPVVSVTGTTSNPWQATGLSQLTNYEFYVQADCGAFNSDWAGPFAFSTLLPALSGNYTIDSTLATGGTNFINFTDFAYALSLGGFAGPVVVDVVAGTGPYNEQIIFGEIPNSSATNTLTINGNGETLEFASSNSSERATLKLNGTDYVTVNDLIIKGTGTYAFTVQLMNNADYITFDNCEFYADETATTSSFSPFVTSNSATSATTSELAASNLTITNSKAIGGYYGMVINGPTSAPFSENNVIMNNEIRDFYYYGLYVRGQNYSQFIGNELHRTNRTNNTTLYTIYMTSNISNTVLSKNILYNLGGTAASTSSVYGIYATSMTSPVNEGILISNNIVHGFGNRNGTQYGMYLSTTGYAQVYHNTVSMDNVNHTGSSTIYTFYHTGANANLDIQNNIFSYTTNSSGTKYCMYFSTNTAVVNSNNNVLYRGATAGTNNTGYWSSTAYNTLADWQTANGGVYDQNSVDADPIFAPPLLTPIATAIDNIGANLLSIVPDDIFGVARTASPDPGAIEFIPLNADIAVMSGKLVKTSECLSNNDSIYVTIKNILGSTLNFAANPVTIFWSVTGPVNSTGNFLIDNGTLNVGDELEVGSDGVDLSVGGVYTLSLAYIEPSPENELAANDTIFDAFEITIIPYLFDAQPDYTLITNVVDQVDLTVSSNVLGVSGSFFISEICHYKTTTGAPVGGWPSYLLADDYIEVTGVPGADLAGHTLEIWTSTALESAQVLGTGTLVGPNGTCIIATGQLGSSVPSPADYYYHSGATTDQGSTTAKGYILRDQIGIIVDAVVYGNFTFPAAAGVTPADWSGTTPAVSSSGNRLEGPYTKDATNWINSGTSPQNPNVVNANVIVPSPTGLINFAWTLNGGIIVENQVDLTVGPWTVNGTYNYIATYFNDCGAFTDTAVVEVNIPQNDLKIVEIISPLPELCYDGSEPVSIALTNLGVAPITSAFNASYVVDSNTPVTETVNMTIAPADTVIFTFATTVDYVLINDTNIYLNTYVNLAGDPFQWNDTLGMDVDAYFIPPAPDTVYNDTVPFGTAATLEVISSYDVNWYDSPTGTTSIGSGSTFVTPVLYNTTSYYASSVVQGIESSGRATYAGTANTTGSNWGLVFDVVNSPTVIETVDIYSVGAGGNITVQLQSNTGSPIETVGPFAYPSGTTGAPVTVTLPLNLSVPVGTGYRLIATSMGGNLIRESSVGGFPYPSPSGNVVVTNGYISGTSTTYYWFYNWQVKGGSGCESDRVEVLAVVDMPSCVPIIAVDIDNVTLTTADLSWAPGSTETAWQIELGAAGFTPTGTATHFASVTPALTLTNLSMSTDYEFYIRSDCGTEYSDWWGPYAFTTQTPALAVDPSTLNFAFVPSGNTAELSYELSGEWLLNGPVIVTAPAGFEVSLTSGSGFSSSVTVNYTAPALAATTIYVQFAPTGAPAVFSGDITNVGGGDDISVSVYGTSMLIYCDAYATNLTDEWLSNVTFAGINNTSGSTGYSDFTYLTGTVEQGGTYPFSATISQTGTYTETVAVWIDWNYNGVFETSERTEIGICSTDGCVVTNNIVVPTDAVPGNTRMRVIQKFSSYSTNPCEVFTYGEVEDYTINVLATTKTLNLNAYIEGLYMSGGMMREAQGLAGPEFGAGVADVITVELYDQVNTSVMLYQNTSVMLNTNGTASIIDIPASFTGEYYIVIKQRNSIETWSMLPVSFAGSGPISYSFTSAASQAYGNNLVLFTGGYYAIFGGDANQDGIVDGSDMLEIENASNFFLQGYNVQDLNGDGLVDGTDMLLIENNATFFIQVQKP